MRDVLAAWGRGRWPSCRVVHEIELGERRADMAFISERDIAVLEIKSSKDTVDRLDSQLAEYRRYAPEVWVAVAPKWKAYARAHGRNRLIVAGAKIENPSELMHLKIGRKKPWRPFRDELVCSRMLELLWTAEAARIAQRTNVIPGSAPTSEPRYKVLPMLARLLTGNEIIREVCRELRARPAFGHQSDPPVSAPYGQKI